MHYCTLLITKEFPTEEIIGKIMEPYSSEKAYSTDPPIRPVFTWDWYQIGGRFNGQIKLKYDTENENKYNWNFYARDGRNGRLFWSFLLTKMKKWAAKAGERILFAEEDFFRSMGSKDGFLLVDGAFIPDILNASEIGCFNCVDKNGNAITRSHWNGNNYEDDEKFDEKLQQIWLESADCYAVIIDIHD